MKRLGLMVALISLVVALRTTPASAAHLVVHDVIYGTETSTGTQEGNTRVGVTFAGTAAGTLPGTFIVVVSYTPADPVCNGTNTLTDGSFRLQSISGDNLIGRVTSGSVGFSPYCAFGSVSASLEVTGGSGAFQGATGKGSFTGTLNHLPLLVGQPAILTGTVRLTIQTPGGGGPQH